VVPLVEMVVRAGAVGAVVAWIAMSAYVLFVQRRRTAARMVMASAVAAVADDTRGDAPPADRVAQLAPLIADASRELIMQAAADPHTPPRAADVLAAHVVQQWGLETLERDAASHRTARDKWRRITALRVLFAIDRSRDLGLLVRALDDRDADVAAAALSLLGTSTDPSAADLLVDALRTRRHQRSRIAVEIDRSPHDVAGRLRVLLTDSDPQVRRWAATLLGRYTTIPNLERDLAEAADDPDAAVRKAAVESLGRTQTPVAAVTAIRLLNDPIPFVRAAALRAVAGFDREDLAGEVATLLGDRDWWVRLAAKECLERMGPGVWPVLVRLLEDHDRFVRNNAAEVFQNLGLLDNLIIMEAATDDPADKKIDLLRRVAAAVRLTDSLTERVGAKIGPRVRELLTTIGLQHVRAA